MLNINLSRSARTNSKVLKSFYLALLVFSIAAGNVRAEDEIAEFDPDNSLLDPVLDVLRDLWAFLSGLIF